MRYLTTGLLLAALCALAAPALADRSDPPPADVPAYVTQAMQAPGRQQDAAQDARRKPGAVLALSGAKPGDTVIELIPGTGYWTKMLSTIVGKQGHVYTVFPSHVAQAHPDSLTTLRQLAATPRYDNVTVMLKPAGALSSLDVPPADVVFTAENLHDFDNNGMGNITPQQFGAEIFPLLKPGGTLLINDHVAAAGHGLRDTSTLHRIDPALVKSQIQAAGFDLDGQSDALRNPTDPLDIKIFDPSIRGHTDQFIFRFVKPERH